MRIFPIVLIVVAVVALSHGLGSTTRHMRPKKALHPANGDALTAVHFSDYLNDPEQGRNHTSVKPFDVLGAPGPIASYAGYFTVNKTTGNSLFGWYFPSLDGNENAPLAIWLQGGPGGASTFGLFSEIGPFEVLQNMSLSFREYTWNTKMSLLFIDNPVGAGFSYSSSVTHYAKSQADVSRDLVEAMLQFYTIFPVEKTNDLYITGESFAGHYIPAFGAAIHAHNQNSVDRIPLAGVSIGDGWTDPYLQLQGYAAMMYNLGLADDNERAVIGEYVTKAMTEIEKGDYKGAFDTWDEMLNGDIYPYPNYFHNITGSSDYDNFMRTDAPASFGYYQKFLNQDSVREAIHAGSYPINSGLECEKAIINDIMFSYAAELELLLSNKYKVLLYSGQLDLIVGSPTTKYMLPALKWPGASDFAQVKKALWYANGETDVAGFLRQADNLMYYIVRGAGHIVPYDQPMRARNMIDSFVFAFNP